MNTSEYRKDPKRVTAAARLLADPHLQQMLETVKQSRPFQFRLDSAVPKVDGDNHSVMLGIIQGWEMALGELEKLGAPLPVPIPDIPMNYPVPVPVPKTVPVPAPKQSKRK